MRIPRDVRRTPYITAGDIRRYLASIPDETVIWVETECCAGLAIFCGDFGEAEAAAQGPGARPAVTISSDQRWNQREE